MEDLGSSQRQHHYTTTPPLQAQDAMATQSAQRARAADSTSDVRSRSPSRTGHEKNGI